MMRQNTEIKFDHNLVINLNKTKEMIVDFRRTRQFNPLPVSIGNEVAKVLENLSSWG